MADTTVDTVDNETTQATPAEATADSAPAEQAPADKPAKKAAAKRAPAKKTAAKKTAAEKTAAEKTAAEKTAAEKTAAEKTAAKKTAAKKTTAKKTTAKKAAAAPAADEQAPVTEAPVDETAVDETPAAGAAVLFQAPEKKPAAKRPAKKATQKPAPKDEEPADDDKATAASAAADEADDTDETDETDAEQGEQGEGTSQAARRRRRRGGRRRRKPSGGGAGGTATDDDDDTLDDESDDAVAQADGDAGDETKAEAKTDAKTGNRSQGNRSQGGRSQGGGSQGGGKAQGAKPKTDGQPKNDANESDEDDTDADGGEQGEGGSSPSSRRRRRRRREGEGSADGGDDANTVTRVRKPRSAEDEITSISGSTRLEAKKQRRRDGREAGRRRAPIVSEAEFLARRESVERVMVVRQRKDLTQIAVIEDKVLVEHYVARESQTSLIGNVYLGRVQNVLPSMEAAFIDIGKGRNAVLYAGEVNWSALGHKEGTPRKIESVLTSGQTVLVQVSKDPIGHKGARLTSQVSLAGRFLVYVPDGTTSGISRKLPDTERGRLKALLKEIVPETAGVIVRTAAEGASEDELTSDVERLKARWEDIESKVAKGNAPQLLYGEPDLTLKVVRDLFTEDFAKLVVQGEDAWDTVREYVEHVAPDLTERLEHYQISAEGEPDKPDAFATYRIDEQIAKGLDRKVWLPSGGSLVIDRTEAMTVVDVNTGKFTGSGGNLEETVTKNNLEAAEEMVRQLRLRDIGGIIVIDFIDMVLESNRDLVLRRLVECLGRDRTRHQVAEVTSLGLVQMTRKRIGTGLLEAFSETCDHCQGRGIVVNDLPVEPRRGGGDDAAPRGARRRRGKGNGQSDEPAAKAVPSPKVVAAMAKPPAPESEDVPAEPGVDEPVADETVADETVTDETVTDETVADERVAEASVAEEAPVTEEVPVEEAPADEAAAEQPEPAAEPATEPAAEVGAEVAPEVVPESVAAPVTTVVTRTRRSSASRPAGPPASASVPVSVAEPMPEPEPAPEPHVEHVPIKKKGTRKR